MTKIIIFFILLNLYEGRKNHHKKKSHSYKSTIIANQTASDVLGFKIYLFLFEILLIFI